MNIELPKQFQKIYSDRKYVRIRKGKLEIHGGCNFEDLMVELAYLIRGKERCYYCGMELTSKQVTIDHRHPRDFGGVTITNNLVPACGKCNSTKSNLNEYEFAIFRTLGKVERKQFFQRTTQEKQKRQQSRKNKNGFDLPKKWVKMYSLYKIREKARIDNSGGRKFTKTMEFVSRYGRFPRPIVISANNILLDGRTVFHVARKLKFHEVPVIQLENVIYFEK